VALTDEQYQQEIAKDLGFGDDAEFLTDVAAVKWEMWAEVAYLGPRVRFLYAKRDAIESLLGGEWQKYDFTDKDVQEKHSVVFANLEKMAERINALILEAERRARGGQVQHGKIAATAPVEPLPFRRDPNDPYYRGDPTKRYPGPNRGC
jgi:hypothetical protein